MIEKLISGGISGIFKSVADTVDKFITTNDEKQAMILELRKIEARETEAMLNSTSTVMKAEAESKDPWVRRARPTFLYIMYIIIVFKFLLLPIFCVALTFAAPDINIKTYVMTFKLPEEPYWLFGSGYLGYGGARSIDKIFKGKNLT